MKAKKHEKITATELVRSLSLIIDKVRMTGKSVYITKGMQTVAELNPPPKSGYPINDLANLLTSLPKLDSDAKNLSEDLKKIRAAVQLPRNPWE